MRIFNQNKTQQLTNVDEKFGKLIPDKLITHHAAVEPRAGRSHYEVIKTYPNGGQDVEEVWDEMPVQGKEAWDEYEDILVYVPYTSEELRTLQLRERIVGIKEQLASWDYKTSKHADGDYTDAEWEEIVNQRKAWREEIRALETELTSI